MSIGLDVWIAKSGSVCQVDDATWNVTIYDAHGKVYQWAGATYANLAAPHAHWAGTIPPGTYVVHAVNQTTGTHTDHAIVTVAPMRASAVILYVSTGKNERPRPVKCKITIKDVVGNGQPVRRLHVNGTAQACDRVELEVYCNERMAGKETVEVFSGNWETVVSLDPHSECSCGGSISVIASCIKHPDCTARYDTDRLNCRDVVK